MNEILLYQAKELSARVEVRVEEDTVWLSRQQIASLFDRDVKTVGKHINNVYSEGELSKDSTVAKFATVQSEGGRQIERQIAYYNLDVIISVGYRVKSKQGTQFRIWANKVLKNHLLKGYTLNQRMNRIEDNVHALLKKVDDIDLQINAHLLPNQGIFFDGQTYDAYDFINQLIKKAKTSIVLIDNYIDDTVITQLTKKKKNVAVVLMSKTISKKLQLDIEKANTQYPTFKTIGFDKAHDRFLILDQKEVYHLGASLKDLGKKWFAFSKLEASSVTILQSIKDLI